MTSGIRKPRKLFEDKIQPHTPDAQYEIQRGYFQGKAGQKPDNPCLHPQDCGLLDCSHLALGLRFWARFRELDLHMQALTTSSSRQLRRCILQLHHRFDHPRGRSADLPPSEAKGERRAGCSREGHE